MSQLQSLLLKVAQSKCLEKAKYIIDAVMKARTQYHINNTRMDDEKYFSMPPGFCSKMDMNPQELELLQLSEDINKNMLDASSTFQVFLKHSPDALKYWLDKCLVKPVPCQFQGEVFFDFLFFNQNEKGAV